MKDDKEIFYLRLAIILGGFLAMSVTLLLGILFKDNKVALDFITMIGFSIGWGLLIGGFLGGRI